MILFKTYLKRKKIIIILIYNSTFPNSALLWRMVLICIGYSVNIFVKVSHFETLYKIYLYLF